MENFSEPAEIKRIFDSHCHYDDSAFDDDRDVVLESLFAEDSQVEYLMHASTDFNSCEYGIRMAEKYEKYYTSAGIHPNDITDDLPDDFDERLKQLALSCSKVKAIGEIGLDYHYDDGVDRNLQKKVFEKQLILANLLDLPVIIHCRDAHGDFMELMRKYKPKGVVHCFSGSVEIATECVKLGLYIGFTGVLTYKNAKKTKDVFVAVPKDRILFETDCPYMAPDPVRKKCRRSRSDMIAYVACESERLCGISAQELIDMASRNTKKLFGI